MQVELLFLEREEVVSLVLIFLPKALSSFVVALAFAGLWHMGILRGLRSVLLVRGEAIA